MKIRIALVATLVTAPLALVLTAFLAGLVHSEADLGALPEEELGT